MPRPERPKLTIAEVAAVTGLTVNTLQRHARSGRIAAVKVGGKWWIPWAVVEHYVIYDRWPRTKAVARRQAARRAAGRHAAIAMDHQGRERPLTVQEHLTRQMQFFEDRFGIPFPPLPVDRAELVRVSDTCQLFATRVAAARPYLVTIDIEPFIAEAPPGYCVVGFYDRGMANFDFYYSYVDDWRRVWLRLNYGGAYTDAEVATARIRAFLPAYLDFEQRLAGRAVRLVVVEAKGPPLYRVELPDGTVNEVRTQIFGHPRCDEVLRQLLPENW